MLAASRKAPEPPKGNRPELSASFWLGLRFIGGFPEWRHRAEIKVEFEVIQSRERSSLQIGGLHVPLSREADQAAPVDDVLRPKRQFQ